MLADGGRSFAKALEKADYIRCAELMEINWEAQKMLAPSSSNKKIDEMFGFAKSNGAIGGKLCGAGGGGAFVFYSKDTDALKNAMKNRFVDCFEIDFEIEYNDIKTLNNI